MTVFPIVVTKSRKPYTVWVIRSMSSASSAGFEACGVVFSFRRSWEGSFKARRGFGDGLLYTGRFWMYDRASGRGSDFTALSPTRRNEKF